MKRNRQPNRLGTYAILGLIALALLFGPNLMGFYVDWLWFGEVGGRRVFWTIFQSRLLLGLFFGLSLAGLTYLNVVIARRSAPRLIPRAGAPEWQQAMGRLTREGLTAALVGGALFVGGLGGIVASARWDDWLRFRNPQAFGVQDPVFKLDIGFYVFQYPFLQFLSGWLFTTLMLIVVATAAVYYLDGAVAMVQQQARIPNAVRVHLSILLGLAVLAKAWDYWLDRYGLLLQPGGVLFGAGYTDIHARLPALNILVGVALVAAVGFFVNARVRALWLPGLALALMAVAGVTVGGIYPEIVQRFVVAPDEQARERPFIQHHLEATRRAYGLHSVESKDYALGRPLARADIAAERETLDNIRLWDYRVLSQTYHGLQRLRDYYDVRNVDIDRYTVGGKYRQVMLAPRELDTQQLGQQQRSWVNKTLHFTHGYGLVMSAVNETDPSGWPVWLARDLPLVTEPGLEVSRPELYYGEGAHEAVIAPSGAKEFDYPVGSDTATSTYVGSGGIPLASAPLRWLFGAFLADWNIVISDGVKPGSRILIRRNIRERVKALAPFLKLDRDPYLVVAEGKLVWVQDAYTTAGTYPYSDPFVHDGSAPAGPGAGDAEPGLTDLNYVRNSVKVTVDGYTGKITLYGTDPSDPVLRSYEKAFPGLFRPADEVPAALRAHLRYPEEQFALQAQKWTRFHIANPDVFYSRSDVWDIPAERLQEGANSGTRRMEPYYVIMRLPGERQAEFALIMPFKTQNGTTLPGWLAARCDGPNYGQLRQYRFPTSSQVDNPEQVDNAIQSDPEVSPKVSLLNQQGSGVLYGNLLVLPVGSSLLYVKPLYVLGTGGQGRSQQGIPKLTYVIVAEKRGTALKVVMRSTLREALSELIGAGGAEIAAPPTGAPAVTPPSVPGGATPAV
ncbi:MAG TPA: UPF0182 family protein, partial [Armatimonadota bacterium]|nr:UPF0182 family protein [Armatimonadota bacterium]